MNSKYSEQSYVSYNYNCIELPVYLYTAYLVHIQVVDVAMNAEWVNVVTCP